MTLALYRIALRLYPRAFRERYAAEMLEAARLELAASPNAIHFFLALAHDTAASLFREYARATSHDEPRLEVAFVVLFSFFMVIAAVFAQQIIRRNADAQPARITSALTEQLRHNNAYFTMAVPTATQELSSRTWLQSRSTFTAIYDSNAQLIASDATLNSTPPQPPRGVFNQIRQRGLYKVTWQPERGVRIALTGRTTAGGGFVLAGQSLIPGEALTARCKWIFFPAWTFGIVGFFMFMSAYRRRLRNLSA